MPQLTLFFTAQQMKARKPKKQPVHKGAGVFLPAPAHPSTTASSMSTPYNEMSKQHSPFCNFERPSQMFRGTHGSHNSTATHSLAPRRVPSCFKQSCGTITGRRQHFFSSASCTGDSPHLRYVRTLKTQSKAIACPAGVKVTGRAASKAVCSQRQSAPGRAVSAAAPGLGSRNSGAGSHLGPCDPGRRAAGPGGAGGSGRWGMGRRARRAS